MSTPRLGHWYGPWLASPPRPPLLASVWERPRWLVLPLTMMLVLTGLSVGATMQRRPPAPLWVADDGQAQLYSGDVGGRALVASQQTLRRRGGGALLSSPPEFFFADPGAGRKLEDVTWLRESAAGTGADPVRWHRLLGEDADGLHLAVETVGGRWRALRPMPLLLPSDDRATWTATGSALTGPAGTTVPDREQPFTWTVRAADDDRTGCRRFQLTLAVGTSTEERTELRCRDTGLTAMSGTWQGRSIDVARVSAYPDSEPAPFTAPTPPRWEINAGWAGRTVPLERGGVAFSVATNAHPAMTRSGTLVLASNPSADAVLIDSRTGRYRFATHLDSTIQVLNTFGDVTVMAGTGRTIRALDDQGRVLWDAAEEDATSVDFARLDDDHIVGVSLDGAVAARDLRTGAVIWRAEVAGDVRTAPVLCGASVAVAASGPAVHVFSAADGRLQRTIEVPEPIDTLDCAGPDLIAGDAQGDLLRFDLTTGKRRWLAHVIETIGTTEVAAGRIWIFSRSGMRPCDLETGVRPDITPGAALDAVGDGTTIFVLTAGGARMITADGQVREVNGPALVGQTALLTAAPDAVWSVNGDGALIRWGPA